MYLKKNFPYLVAGYIAMVGVFLGISALIEGTFLDPAPPGRYFLLALSLIFLAAGIYSVYLFNHGKLKKSGKSISEVRQEAVEKMKDPAMLAQIALEEENPEIRETAERRLGELNN